MKQFRTKELLNKWITDNFYREPADVWDIDVSVNEADIVEKLLSEGYDLDNLTANGEAYEIDGHTNNGWLWDDEADLEHIDSLRAEGRLIKRNSIRGKRMQAGLSRAEMSRQFEIPLRTLENWEAGIRKPSVWAEKLIIEKLEHIIGDLGQY